MNSPLELRLQNLLQQCSFRQLKQIQTQIITTSLHRNIQILLKFLRRSTEFGKMEYPELIFARLGDNEITLWNVMIRGYAYNGPVEECISMFVEMPQRELKPNNFTYPYVLNSCGELRWFSTGKAVQTQVVKTGFETASSVSGSLFKLYLNMVDSSSFERSEIVKDARKIFDGMYLRPIELWNRMIYGHVNIGDVECARNLFDEMLERDVVSWNSMISGYVRTGDAENARELFERMPEKNVVSWTSMIGVHMSAGDVETARNLFDKMPQRNIVSWNSLISGYTQNGKFEEALDLFAEMQLKGENPDGFTFAAVLSACSHLGALEFGKWIHCLIKDWSNLAVIVGTALVEMYAKCGDVNRAFVNFIKIRNKDVFCYNTMIKSLAIHGRTEDAIETFYMMQKKGLKPNEFTFTSVLFACSHGGFIDKGREIFSSIEKEHGRKPTLDHYGCMIDLLSRNGQVEEAQLMIKEMPFKPDIAIWGALLGGCLVRGDVKVAESVIEKARATKEKESGVHVLLANIHASVGQWHEAKVVRDKMEEKNIRKRRGWSVIYYDNRKHLISR